MLENPPQSKSYKIFMLSFGILLIFVLMVALIPPWRELAQSLLWPHERTILAKSQGSLDPEGPLITVIKVKTREGLFVEIYRSLGEDAAPELWTQFPLDGTQDGYFNFQNQATNLVLTDVDNDGYMDIIAPTFDDRQQARMNIFRYDAETEGYVRMDPALAK